MEINGKSIEQLNSSIEHLTSNLAANERRFHAMQRKLRILSLMFAAVVLIAVVGFNHSSQAQQPPMAPVIAQQHYNEMLARSQRLNLLAERVLQHIEKQQQKQMDLTMKPSTADDSMQAKSDMSLPDMGAMIMLMLHDMKVALELVPQMANDMRTMSMVAQDMNHKMTVITSNMDSTMGRMGRNMPWLGW
jgi:hypothetical protein